MSNLKIRFGFEFDDGRRLIAPFDQDSPITVSPAAEPMVCRYKSWDLVGLGFDVDGETTSPASVTIYSDDFGGSLIYAIILSDVDGFVTWGNITANYNSAMKVLGGLPFSLVSGQHTQAADTPVQRSQATEADVSLIYFYPVTKAATAPVKLEAWLFGVEV
jgi:hypothetical protein